MHPANHWSRCSRILIHGSNARLRGERTVLSLSSQILHGTIFRPGAPRLNGIKCMGMWEIIRIPQRRVVFHSLWSGGIFLSEVMCVFYTSARQLSPHHVRVVSPGVVPLLRTRPSLLWDPPLFCLLVTLDFNLFPTTLLLGDDICTHRSRGITPSYMCTVPLWSYSLHSLRTLEVYQ